MEIFEVRLSSKAQDDLGKIPLAIVFKLQAWIDGVRIHGVREMRKRPGFHDEPLKAHRKGQRSIRLNKAYRAIYNIDRKNHLHFIDVIEVNKHDY